jgi:hypothetical protein
MGRFVAASGETSGRPRGIPRAAYGENLMADSEAQRLIGSLSSVGFGLPYRSAGRWPCSAVAQIFPGRRAG